MTTKTTGGTWSLDDYRSPARIISDADPHSALALVYLTAPRKRGRSPEHIANAYVMTAAPAMLAALKAARPVCEDAYHDAVALEEEPSDYAAERAQSTAAAKAAWDAVEAAITAATV